MSSNDRFPLDAGRVGAAVFDLGGVLIGGGPREVIAFGQSVGLEPAVWEGIRRSAFGNDSMWAELERGEISFQTFTDELIRRVREAGGTVDEELAKSFMGRPDPMAAAADVRPKMMDAVRSLKAVMPTALLTNNVREWREGWSAIFNDDSLFDVIVDSSDVGARKPEPRIYEITRERLGVDHEAIFFVDDIGQNLKAAHSLGWQTPLYTSTDEVVEFVADIHDAR